MCRVTVGLLRSSLFWRLVKIYRQVLLVLEVPMLKHDVGEMESWTTWVLLKESGGSMEEWGEIKADVAQDWKRLPFFW